MGPEATVAREVADALRDARPAEPGLAGGSAGLALAFDRFETAWPGQGYGELADDLLAATVGALERERLAAGLYDGVAGIAWAIAHLPERAGAEWLSFLDEQLDPLLLRHLGGSAWRGDYDLVSGLVGIGVYALERLNAPSGGALLHAVVERLAELAQEIEPGVSWHRPPELLPDWQRERFPRGYINLGLAHGVPGVIGLLGAACANGVAEDMTRPLLERAVAWLLAQDSGEAFGHWIADAEVSGPSRSGWCYGDPGVAAALLLAARGAGRRDWEERAIAIARRATARDRAGAGVIDTPLCHGAAGLAHIFGRLHAASGERELGAAAAAWVDRTVAMRDKRQGIAGFPFMVPADDGALRPAAQPGLLEGAAGVALALLSAEAPERASWDRFLLLSAPGLP